MAVRKATKPQRRNATALQAVNSMEIAQIAGEAGFIGGVAGVMVGITLVVRRCIIYHQDCSNVIRLDGRCVVSLISMNHHI